MSHYIKQIDPEVLRAFVKEIGLWEDSSFALIPFAVSSPEDISRKQFGGFSAVIPVAAPPPPPELNGPLPMWRYLMAGDEQKEPPHFTIHFHGTADPWGLGYPSARNYRSYRGY